MSDVIYFYVKGQGWLAGYEEHMPKPKDDGWRHLTIGTTTFEEEMRRYQARLREEGDRYWAQVYGRFDRPRNIPREPRTAPDLNITTTAGTTTAGNNYNRYTYGYDNRYFMVHDEVIPQPAPRPRPTGQPRPVENQTRFVGTDVTVDAPEETANERRVREYRDAIRRWQRNR